MSLDPYELVLASAIDVKRLGSDKAIARARPESKHRSVSIARGRDGRVLLKSWTGRSIEEICSLWGLQLSDLFPPRPEDLSSTDEAAMRSAARHVGWAAVVRVLSREAWVILCAVGQIMEGCAITEEDRQRLSVANERIQSARAVLCG